MKARGLVLPGYACTSGIWGPIRTGLDANSDVTWVDWPRDLAVGFHTVAAFAHWSDAAFPMADYDFVVGHSLGGLVALELGGSRSGRIPGIVLMETFLTPPNPFFQTLFAETTPGEEQRPIRDMLETESAYYSPRLRHALRRVDMSKRAIGLGKKIHALYGDRGCGDPDRVVKELAWPAGLQGCVEVKVVRDAAHFPMIENAKITLALLQDALASF